MWFEAYRHFPLHTMKSFTLFVILLADRWHNVSALNFSKLSPPKLFDHLKIPGNEAKIPRSDANFPKIAYNFDLSERSNHVAKEGPLFVIAFDVDETLLSCDYDKDSKGCSAHPFSMVLINYLHSLVALPNARIHSVVGLTNGLGTKNKFARAGLPGLDYFFRTLYERDFVNFYDPLLKLKDLVALSKQLAHDDADFATVADRTVIILIDDKGNTHEVFNRCHKGNRQHVSLNISEFAPFDYHESPRDSPFSWSEFNLSLMATFLTTYFSDVELLQQIRLTSTPRHLTNYASAVHAADLLRLHASVAGVGRGTTASSMYSKRKFSEKAGHVDPLIICPHENLDPAIPGENPVYAVLMLDGRWMFKYLIQRLFDDDDSTQEVEGYTRARIEQHRLEKGVQELLSAFRRIDSLVTDIVVKCYKLTIEETSDVFDCAGFAKLVRELWQSGSSMTGGARPNPFLFTFEHGDLNRMGSRQYNSLQVVLQALGMPEDRTVLLVMDSAIDANTQSPEATKDIFKLDAGFFKPGPPSVRYHDRKNRKMLEHLEYQFVLKSGVGDDLSNLHNFMERLAFTLEGNDLATPKSYPSSSALYTDEYKHALKRRLRKHLDARDNYRAMSCEGNNCSDILRSGTSRDDTTKRQVGQKEYSATLDEKLIDLSERIRANFGAALVYEADEIAIPFYAVP